MRDRSVVRSSVIPSARYSCAGSSLRLANGSTAIDRRGAVAGNGPDALLGGPALTAVGGATLAIGQSHHAATAIATIAGTASANGAITAGRQRYRGSGA